MSSKVIGVYRAHWRGGFSIPAKPSRNPAYLFKWACWFKANPRTESYMQDLFTSHYPEGQFVDGDACDSDCLRDQVRSAQTVVLLYPDAIGIGFSALEKIVLCVKSPMTGVKVLNGRRREFIFNANVKWSLRFRRFLEVTMLPEICVSVVMLIVTPFLVSIDVVRGRK